MYFSKYSQLDPWNMSKTVCKLLCFLCLVEIFQAVAVLVWLGWKKGPNESSYTSHVQNGSIQDWYWGVSANIVHLIYIYCRCYLLTITNGLLAIAVLLLAYYNKRVFAVMPLSRNISPLVKQFAQILEPPLLNSQPSTKKPITTPSFSILQSTLCLKCYMLLDCNKAFKLASSASWRNYSKRMALLQILV